jgi:hypothetical protein
VTSIRYIQKGEEKPSITSMTNHQFIKDHILILILYNLKIYRFFNFKQKVLHTQCMSYVTFRWTQQLKDTMKTSPFIYWHTLNENQGPFDTKECKGLKCDIQSILKHGTFTLDTLTYLHYLSFGIFDPNHICRNVNVNYQHRIGRATMTITQEVVTCQ